MRQLGLLVGLLVMGMSALGQAEGPTRQPLAQHNLRGM